MEVSRQNAETGEFMEEEGRPLTVCLPIKEVRGDFLRGLIAFQGLEPRLCCCKLSVSTIDDVLAPG